MNNIPSIFESFKVDEIQAPSMSESVFPDFDFFTSEKASNILDTPASGSAKKSTKKRSQKTTVVSEESIGINGMVNPIPGGGIADTDYSKSYSETNNLLRGAIMQADELSAEIKSDIDAIRSSKTMKSKYTYLTNLTASAGSLLSTKISAIKELNSTITQAHNLELNRFKTLKLDKSEDNDDMKMMDIYSAFVNTPVGSYTPSTPSIQDITLGVNGGTPNVAAVEMVANNTGITQAAGLTAEQNRMRMESNPNIQTVVRYNQSTGQRFFDVIDKNTGASVPNYPRPDDFLLEDTTIDIHTGIARNRNINTVWPLVIDGGITVNEY